MVASVKCGAPPSRKLNGSTEKYEGRFLEALQEKLARVVSAIEFGVSAVARRGRPTTQLEFSKVRGKKVIETSLGPLAEEAVFEESCVPDPSCPMWSFKFLYRFF
jgi:hypothetical protein